MLSVTQLESIQANALNALLLDSIKPRADYSLDGQTVSRTAWRESMLKLIRETQELMQFAEPYELKGQII